MCHFSERDNEIVLKALSYHIKKKHSFTGYDVWLECCQIATDMGSVFPPEISDTSARVREIFNVGDVIFVSYGVTKTDRSGLRPLLYFPIPKEIEKRCEKILIAIEKGKHVPPRKPRYAKT